MPIYVKEFIRGSKCRIKMLGHGRDSFFLEEFIRQYQEDPNYDVASLIVLMDRFSNTGRINDKRKLRKLHGAEGLFEFKTRRGMRVSWAWEKDSVIICGYCFIKKSDSTPKHLVETSIQWIKAYKAALESHQIVEVK